MLVWRSIQRAAALLWTVAMARNLQGQAARSAVAWMAGALLLLAAPVARAEIYGWVDAYGHFTYSNLPPPRDARVTDVIPEDPFEHPGPAAVREAQEAAARDRQRLQELELARLQRQVVDYPAPPAMPPPLAGCGYDAGPGCDLPGYYVVGGLGWAGWPRGGAYLRHARNPGAPHRGGPAVARVGLAAHGASSGHR
jgi:hypothetical protein